jgi:Asp-tRNA(Asn)/Glu-tRNA(Gln) amidotransferase C subunit
MIIMRADVAPVARLARLGLSDAEMDRLASELTWMPMQVLRRLDTSAIRPTE